MSRQTLPLQGESGAPCAARISDGGSRLRREPPLSRVYDDVNPKLLAMAMRSLRAHLLKLRDEGAAEERDGRWALSQPTR